MGCKIDRGCRSVVYMFTLFYPKNLKLTNTDIFNYCVMCKLCVISHLIGIEIKGLTILLLHYKTLLLSTAITKPYLKHQRHFFLFKYNRELHIKNKLKKRKLKVTKVVFEMQHSFHFNNTTTMYTLS